MRCEIWDIIWLVFVFALLLKWTDIAIHALDKHIMTDYFLISKAIIYTVLKA